MIVYKELRVIENKSLRQRCKTWLLLFLFVLSSFVFAKEISHSYKIDFIEIGFERVEKLLKEGQQAKAEKLFHQIVRDISPDNSLLDLYNSSGLTIENYPYYLYLLGDHYYGVYSEKWSIKKAIKIYRKIINDYPSSHFPEEALLLTPSAQIKIAEIFRDINPLESIRQYQKAIDRYPNMEAEFHFYGGCLIEPRALLQMGYIYERILRNYDKSIHSYRQVVEKYPLYFEEKWSYPAATAQLRITRICRKHFKNFKRAIEEAKKVLNLEEHTFIDPSEPRAYDVGLSWAEALCKIAEIHQQIEEHALAIEYFKKVINTYPDKWFGYFESESDRTYGQRAINGLRESNIKAFGIEKTIFQLREIEKKNKSNYIRAYALYVIGTVYEKELNDKKKALEEYKKVLGKYPDARDDFFGSGAADLAEKRISELMKKDN